MTAAAAPAAPLLRDVRPLLEQLGDLKRVRVAGRPGSLADTAFLAAWARLLAGEPVRDVAAQTTAAHVAAVRLAGLDAATLRALGLDAQEAADVLLRALDEVAGLLPDAVLPALRAAARRLPAAGLPPAGSLPVGLPPAVSRQVEQPRAGATAPGRARLVTQPAESHADHCLTVAVSGWLLAPACGADASEAFLLGLAHHLHNATMPDAGFAGEVLLGEHLPAVVRRAEDAGLAQLPEPLAATVRRLLDLREPADGALGAVATCFHCADALDRVLEALSHEAPARYRAEAALDDLELVHAGPVQGLQRAVLADAGVWPRPAPR